MLTLGFVAGASLGIWDPVEALIQLSPNVFAMFVLLTFVLLAQITTNLTINILPPALIFMDTFRMTWSQGVLLSGVLGVLSCPWLMANATAFFGFNYSAPARAGSHARRLLLIIRKRTLVVAELYDTTPGGRHWYSSGFNVADSSRCWCRRHHDDLVPADLGCSACRLASCCTCRCIRGSTAVRCGVERRSPVRNPSGPRRERQLVALRRRVVAARLMRPRRDHDTEVTLRRLARQIAVEHIRQHELRIALQRATVPPPTPPMARMRSLVDRDGREHRGKWLRLAAGVHEPKP